MHLSLKKIVASTLLAANLMPAAITGSIAAATLLAPVAAYADHCASGQIEEPSMDGSTHTCRAAGSSQTSGYTRSQQEPGGWGWGVWKSIVSWTSSLFLDLGAGILVLAGYVFDYLVKYVVVQFGQTMRDLQVMNAIERGWTVFRDFTNILIIGFFVFIAISIILGLSEFGQKKLIANVLVIAVLMNFSLLFTKLVIDGSNFVAYSIYAQMASANGAQATQFNVSEAFLKPMKPQGIWDSYKLVQQSTQTSGQAFVFSVVGGILLLMVAGVLLYGSFLLASRGILFIILMLTAPLAFATYLIPTLAKGEYGWHSWWKSLLNNAAFGPLLMILLALSLAILNAAGSKATGTIGGLIVDPGNATPQAWTTIFVYIIGIGLLFVSFKLASSFAGTISGFKLGAVLPAFGLAAGARLAAFAGRQGIGRPALWAADRMEAKSKETGRSLFSRQLYDFGAQKFKGAAKSDFNAMRTGLVGGTVAGLAGLKVDTLAGKKIGGAEGAEHAASAAAAEIARRITPKNEDQKKTAEAAIDAAIKANPDLSSRQSQAEQARDRSSSTLRDEETKRAKLDEQHTAQLNTLHAALEEAKRSGNQTQVQSAELQLATAKREQAQVIGEQTEKIKSAKREVDMAQSALTNVQRDALEISKAQNEGLKNLVLGRDGKMSGFTRKEDVAHDLAMDRFTAGLFTDSENARIAHHAAEEVGKQEKKKKLKDSGIIDAFKEEVGGGGGAAAEAHPPAAPRQAPPAADHGPASGGGHGDHH